MEITYRSLTSTLLLLAFGISAAFQLYRASLGTGAEVDQFSAAAAAVYAAGLALALALRADRRWIWWTTGVLLTVNLGYGVVGYYPMVYAARPLTPLDWLEGTAYTGLLLTALGCTVLRLTEVRLTPRSSGDEGSANRRPQPVRSTASR